MSQQGTIRRYSLILEKIGRNQYPTFETIRNYLFDQGFEVSDRTVQRDIEQIRVEFGVDIEYDRQRNGYFINKETSVNIDSFFRFLEIVVTAELLTESLKESKDTLTYINFESEGDFNGIEHLKPLLFAIKNKRKITFTHEKFNTGFLRKFTLKPYLLREFQNRWYVIGIPGGMGEFRTFGIDRISELQVLTDTFQLKGKTSPAELFEHTVGLTYSDADPEDVILSLTPLQGKYVKSLRMHRSQIIVKETEEEVIIQLHLTPNYEFKQKLLMLGANVKVLKPRWLAQEIASDLSAALNRYK